MIRVKSLLEATSKHSTIYFVPHLPSTKAGDNVRHAVKQSGTKTIYLSSHKDQPVSFDDRKAAFLKIARNHDNMFKPAETIFHAADEEHKKGITHLTVMSEPSRAKELEDKLNQTHGNKFDQISVKHLPHDVSMSKHSVKDIDPSLTNKEAKDFLSKIKTESFKIGDFVQYGNVEGEILSIHPKYAIVISEGVEHRVWTDVLSYSENQPKRNQLYKESFIYKGYRTKNFTRPISETFKEISLQETDEYALLECIKVFDYVLGISDTTIEENFKMVRIQIERLKRYSQKIGTTYITEQFISAVEEELLKYAILEGVRFTTTDRNMVAKVIAMVAGTSTDNADPTNTINNAAISLRTSQLTPQGWMMIGRLMNTATKAGIKWNKETFSASIRQEMGLI